MNEQAEYQVRIEITLGNLTFHLEEDLYILADEEEEAEGEAWETLFRNLKPGIMKQLFSFIKLHIEEA